MKKFFGKLTALLFICSTLMVACNKYYSIETPQTLEVIAPATGSLQDNQGNCLGITIHGNYYKGIALNNSNYISADVNITNYGTFLVHTDTVNGCWFASDASYANYTGVQTITLKGYGTPTDTVSALYHVHFLNTSCIISISTQPTPHISTETDYFPMSVGSYWTEDSSQTNVAAKDTIRYWVSPLTKTIGVNNYKLFLSSNKDTVLYRKDGAGHYYEYSSLFSSVGVDKFEYKFLDDQLPVGSTWQTDPIYGSYKESATASLPLKIILQCTIKSKNQSYQLLNQSVDSVIHIQEQLLLTSPDGKSDYTSLFGIAPNDAYYAKKIGLIYYTIPFTGFFREAKSWYIQ